MDVFSPPQRDSFAVGAQKEMSAALLAQGLDLLDRLTFAGTEFDEVGGFVGARLRPTPRSDLFASG